MLTGRILTTELRKPIGIASLLSYFARRDGIPAPDMTDQRQGALAKTAPHSVPEPTGEKLYLSTTPEEQQCSKMTLGTQFSCNYCEETD